MTSALLALCTVIAVVPLTIPLAERLGAIARPARDRWSSRAVTTLGGLGLSIGLIVGTVLTPMDLMDRVAVAVGVGALLILGLRDDLAVVSPRVRLGLQALVGVTFVVVVAWAHPAIWLAVPIAAVVVPLAANATNMADNADALATSLTIITAITVGGIALVLVPSSQVPGLSWIIVACCLGFLAYNLPPARVFMGDAGSLPLGFALAATSLLLLRDGFEHSGAPLVPLLLAAPTAWAVQLGDVAMVFITRLHRGSSPFRGGVDHSSHRLMRAGFSAMGAVALLSLLAAFSGLLGLLAAASRDTTISAIALLGIVVGISIFEAVLARRTSHDGLEPLSGGRNLRPNSGTADLISQSNEDS